MKYFWHLPVQRNHKSSLKSFVGESSLSTLNELVMGADIEYGVENILPLLHLLQRNLAKILVIRSLEEDWGLIVDEASRHTLTEICISVLYCTYHSIMTFF